MNITSLQMTFAELCALQPDDIQTLYALHERSHPEAISTALADHAFAIFAADSTTPILTSRDIADFPTDERLMELRRKHNGPVFVYPNPDYSVIETPPYVAPTAEI